MTARADTDRLDVAPSGTLHRGEFRLLDLGAPAVVVVAVLLQFETTANVFRPPGSVLWGMLPAGSLLVLALTPVDRLRRAVISLPLVTFVLWLGASYLWTESPGPTLFLVRSQLIPLLLVALVAATFEPRRLTRVLVTTMTTVVVFSLVAAAVWPEARRVVFVEGLYGPQEGFRGLFEHKNLLGIFAVYALAMQLAFLRHPWRRPLLLLTIATLLATRSATAGSGMFVVMFMWIWLVIVRRQQTPRARSVVGVVAVSSVVIAVLLALRVLPALLGLYQKDITFSGRTDIWAGSLWAFARRPLTGYGLGGIFNNEPPALTYEIWRRIGFEAAHAHNGVIALLVDTGVVGVALVAVLLTSVVAQALRLLGDPTTAGVGQWALLTIGPLLFMSISEPLFTGPHLLWLGLITVVVQRTRSDQRRLQRRGYRSRDAFAPQGSDRPAVVDSAPPDRAEPAHP